MSYWKHTITGVDFSQYKLWEREQIFSHVCNENGVTCEQPKYAICWEDPANPDEPMKVTTPSPTWLAMAMHGGILPPVEVYWELKKDEAQPGFTRHTRGYLLHDTPPIPAMTEEEAMEYLIMKDIPPHVWHGYKGNRQIIKIVPRSMIPNDRSFRNSWRIDQFTEENTDV